MQYGQLRWTDSNGWQGEVLAEANVVFVFADHPFFQTEACYAQLRDRFPSAHIVGCSSSGSVLGTEISDGDVVATAVKLERGRVELVVSDFPAGGDVRAVGATLIAQLKADDLRHAFVISDGLQVNGSELAKGLNSASVAVTGGLAGDGTRFGATWVMADAPATQGRIAALGLYGDLRVRSGCFAGWQEFGAERVVTKSVGNVVYEIDGEPALTLYKKYLGDQAAGLPGSGLRFPLSVQESKADRALIRTLLAVDEAAQSLTFAGDVPQGYLCKLMRTNLDSLIDNAGMAAEAAQADQADATGVCLVVSCVGRRLVLGQLTEDELEIVRETLGENTAITGFYSYGELAPFSDILQCQLHNQTMTLTTLYE
ncbi:FIST N-terminal domain-containing protein [Ferriphaselus sp. R-1]|uniref:FIST signal transduction protein n=1 Tax=Ferriphaselus sp. R-1 TaxID=1485544 RepID=UPI0005572BDD|nr:FIST N-terminal domain-containing protein [Ferriphaselus sp. R-1]